MSNSGSASPAGVRPPPCSSSSSSESSSFNSATSSSFKNMPKNWRAEIGVVRCALCRKKLVNLQHGSHECGGWGSAALEAAEKRPPPTRQAAAAATAAAAGAAAGRRSATSRQCAPRLQATLAVGSSKKRVEPMQIEGDLTLPSPRS